MAVSTFILNNRFGYGIRPGAPAASSVAEALAGLTARDPLEKTFRRPSIKERIKLYEEDRKIRRDMRNNVAGAGERRKDFRKKMRMLIAEDRRAFLARASLSDFGFRERLVGFWADNFTVAGKNQQLQLAIGSYVDEAIRPNIAGNFSELLKAVVTHPAMLLYLDQNVSVGPNSPVGKRRERGLNENLAREILELHTMGVEGSYTQDDVRQFAELLTGFGIGKNGFSFDPKRAEPGAETVLGKSYGGERPSADDVFAFLDDLAVHPDTAKHVGRKLAVHFVSETPPQALVDAISAAYRDSKGDLVTTYEAMLTHPASVSPKREKVKQPTEYVISTVRALDVGDVLADSPVRELREGLAIPLMAMGQELFRAPGPDGWSEAGADWITPPALAARIEWATLIAREYGQDVDPRELLRQVLGEDVSNALKVAVAGAESKWEGVALLLVSPEFNRR